jgi:hypothetical protein
MSSPRRAAASAIALVLLAAQATGLLHLVVVRHEVCPLHGDVVEHGAAQDPNDGVAAVAVRPAPTPVVGRASHHARAHGHDHCLTAFANDDLVSPQPTQIAFALVEREAARPRAVAVAAPRGPPLFRLAPKNSPPA